MFEFFDIDKSGTINANELKVILTGDGKVSDEAWKMIIKDIDKDNDGEISFDEFKKMMDSIMNYVQK
jgi:calcium-dependent protein kinase